MAWVQQTLKGAQFAFEVINMMFFIMEEAAQTSSMACGTAMQNLKMDLAKEIIDSTLIESRDQLWNYWVVYGIPMIPNHWAWFCFYHAYRVQTFYYEDTWDIYKRLIDLGLDPRPGARGKRL